MKLQLSALLLTVGLLSPAAYAKCPKEVTLGWEPYKPFQMLENGKYKGLDFDIAFAILEKMGCKVKPVQKPWKENLADIERGKMTLTGSADKTAERQKFAYFSDYYVFSKRVLFVKKGESRRVRAEKLTDLSRLRGFKLGIIPGYEYGEEFHQAMKDPYFQEMTVVAPNEVTNLKKIIAGEISGGIFNEFVGKAVARSEGLMDQLEIAPVEINTEEAYFMFSKKAVDEKFVKEFNKQLTDLRTSGAYQKILDKYLQ